MRGKPVTSGERAIILNVFKHLKGNFPLESQGSIIERTSKATGSSISTIKRIIKEERPRSPGKKRPNRKKFTKLDTFHLSVIRRITHSFYSRNESPTLTKRLENLKEEINFPYGRTHLFRLLKTLGFKYKKRGRERIQNERSDLIMWRESFLRRIREVRGRAIILNVFKHLKGNFPLESQGSIIERTSKATGSSISTIKRIIKEERPRSPGKKRPNRKKFTKLDTFHLSVIRRITHSFYSRNESPTLTKRLENLKEEINFPYGRTHLFRLLKTLGFKYKKRGRERIQNERSDLIMWRESFLRRIREVREKEPQREIVYTYETWLNGGHRVKKE